MMSSIGRMLDMGGMPSAASDQSVIRMKNVSKNSKLQAVAFDFEVLTRSIEDAAKKGELAAEDAKLRSQTTTVMSSSLVQPDLDQIQQVASLLKVPVDLEGSSSSIMEPNIYTKKTVVKTSSSPVGQDIRSKYAAKLNGGLAGIELAKFKFDDTLKSGDAADFLTARKMAIKDTAASPTKWMALTGTGKLLSYLTHRSIRIALLPNPRLEDLDRQQTELKYMTDFSTQLKDIVIDTVVPFDNSNAIETRLRKGILDELGIDPLKILLVSDKDEYLKVAKDLGMITCRLRSENARRGNVTANYNAPDVPSVQEVVNEITGISFNAVLNR